MSDSIGPGLTTAGPQQTGAHPRVRMSGGERLLLGLAGAVALFCLMPIAAVALAAVMAQSDTLALLWETVLLRYMTTTALLVVIVATGTFLIGTLTAWLVVMTEFPGRRVLEIALVLPLAFPAYVMAYAYTHILDHPGIVQATLRQVMGWGPRDSWFPEIRSLGGAAIMLTLVLYPYVYLLARAAFIGQSATTFFAARALGRTPTQSFLAVSLPMARPAIASGVLLAMMETIADFGTVAFFGVQTLATGIYTSFIILGDRGGAAQLAVGLLSFALCLAIMERISRGNARYDTGRRMEGMARMPLTGARRWLATAMCGLPVLLGAALPAVALGLMAIGSGQDLLSRRYIGFIQNSLTLATIAALVTVTAAVLLGSLNRVRPGHLSTGALHMARIGYAVPGGVIAVGLLVPLAGLDNRIDDFMEARFGIDTGLLLTGSIWVLVGAYMIRFLAVAIGAYEGGISAVSPNMDAAARVLGQGTRGTVLRIHLPILRPSLMTALLIVFVDVMKELPATLIMRPFNYDTLAVQAHRLAADERLDGAAVPSLVIAGLGLLPVILLMRRIRRRD